MTKMSNDRAASRFRRVFPPLQWLAEYQAAWLGRDVVAGVTLAAYAIPVSLAYAGLAGLPPQAGVYGYVLGGLGYALFGSSRQLAVGPTSAISLMIAVTVGAMADGDMQRYAQIASLAALTVALLAFVSWLLRLSVLVLLISDSVLVGFKIGAGLIIAMTQIPSILGVSGGGHNFFERVVVLAGQLGNSQILVITVGLIAVALLLIGDRVFPGRPVALAVVIAGIAVASIFGLQALGVPATGPIPSGLPSLSAPSIRLRDVEGIIPLAAGCLLLAYIEGVSAARTFAAKHRYPLDPRQEFLGIGAANLATAFGQGYPVAGGLSQSAVNDKAGARSPLALVFASIALALCLLYLTDLLENLPKAVLAAVVLTAILGLFDFAALRRMWRVSRMDFYAALIALLAVLVLGILHGILLAALACIVLLLLRVSRPHVAFLGRVPGTDIYSDMARHPDTQAAPDVLIVRPESSLIYANADVVFESILKKIETMQPSGLGLVVCDLSASPFIDLAGTRMLHVLAAKLAENGTRLRIVGARGYVREVLRADGVAEKVGGIDKTLTIGGALAADKEAHAHREAMMSDATNDFLPSAKDCLRKSAEMEAEKAAEYARKRKAAEDEKKALLDRLKNPSGVSDEERMKRAAAIINRAVSNGLTEVEVGRFSNKLFTDKGRAINQQEPGWEETLTGLPLELLQFWKKHLEPRGYHIKFQVADWPDGMPGDISLTLMWRS